MREGLSSTFVACAVIAALALAAPSVGQEVEARAGETYVKAEPVERGPPVYPPLALSDAREGWVMMSFIISEQGAVSEAMIEDSSGNEDFERAALNAREKWRYKPATLDGEPVAQSMTNTIIRFQLDGGTAGASKRFLVKYREIQKLISANDLAGAEQLLADLQYSERHNLYEEAWFGWLNYAYLIAAGSQDQEELQRWLRSALGYEEDYLPPDMFVAAIERLYVSSRMPSI